MQKQWWFVALIAGCSGSHAVAPVAPPIEPPVAAAPADATEVAVVPDAAPPKAPGTCAADLTSMLPTDTALTGTVFYRDGAKIVAGKYNVCDTPDRVVLWADGKRTKSRDRKVTNLAGNVIAISRSAVDHVARAAYSKGSSCYDDCAGPGGGHAGCSMQSGCTVGSKVLGDESLSLYAEQGYSLAKGETNKGCGPQGRGLEYGGVLGFCSTATHLAVLTGEACGDDGRVLTLAVYDNPHDRDDESFVPTPMAGDPDGAKTSGTRWTYAFPAFAGTRGATLSIDVGATPSATLEVDGVSEDCFAFTLQPVR